MVVYKVSIPQKNMRKHNIERDSSLQSVPASLLERGFCLISCLTLIGCSNNAFQFNFLWKMFHLFLSRH